MYVLLYSFPWPFISGCGCQVFKDATSFFSRATPNLANVIPAMDRIDKILTTNSLDDTTFQDSVRAACSLAKKTLNRYYDKTDASEGYRIAMGKLLSRFSTVNCLI